jgi:heme a synthase
VTMKLFPAIVTAHLLGGMVLLFLLRAQGEGKRHAPERAQAGDGTAARIRPLLLATFAALWLQIALGGWVSTNYAVLACNQFPACQGSLWPAMDFRQGFTLWRALGSDGAGGNLSFQALTAIHYAHRLVAYLLFALLLALAWRGYRTPALHKPARWVAGLALLQVATGLGNVLLGWPLAAAVLHTAGAAALVVVLTGMVHATVLAGKPLPARERRASSRPLGTGRLPA